MPTVSPVSDSLDTPPSDRQLMAAHLAGDQGAFTELVRRHRDRLWAVALRTLSDREEAADALQDALISAYRNAGSYRGDAAVTTWLHRVVVNACLDRLRRRKARPADALGEREVVERIDEHRRTEARIDVHAALATLPEPQRAALVLVDLHDYSVSEAAQILGVAEGTVKSRCSRARTALAVLLRPAMEASGHATKEGSAKRRAAPAPPQERVTKDTPAGSEVGGNRAATPRVGPTGADLHRNVTEPSQREDHPPVPPTSNLAAEGGEAS
jgi:RNA polymerase sigma-70 factor, ECF subfamily